MSKPTHLTKKLPFYLHKCEQAYPPEKKKHFSFYFAQEWASISFFFKWVRGSQNNIKEFIVLLCRSMSKKTRKHIKFTSRVWTSPPTRKCIKFTLHEYEQAYPPEKIFILLLCTRMSQHTHQKKYLSFFFKWVRGSQHNIKEFIVLLCRSMSKSTHQKTY